ncbi:hypothetical protein FRAHR75_230040 [Frankia sp. Hr75.2]|nr:hypothetical protein FRAHR75_230040 [Frankia sp. Hr75.2]
MRNVMKGARTHERDVSALLGDLATVRAYIGASIALVAMWTRRVPQYARSNRWRWGCRRTAEGTATR